jgi:hypothetical protein
MLILLAEFRKLFKWIHLLPNTPYSSTYFEAVGPHWGPHGLARTGFFGAGKVAWRVPTSWIFFLFVGNLSVWNLPSCTQHATRWCFGEAGNLTLKQLLTDKANTWYFYEPLGLYVKSKVYCCNLEIIELFCFRDNFTSNPSLRSWPLSIGTPSWRLGRPGRPQVRALDMSSKTPFKNVRSSYFLSLFWKYFLANVYQ